MQLSSVCADARFIRLRIQKLTSYLAKQASGLLSKDFETFVQQDVCCQGVASKQEEN